MTPQDIRETTFEKAMFGGYDMGGVDDFMEEAAAELEAAQSALQRKRSAQEQNEGAGG